MALTYTIVDTGQTTSYGDSAVIAKPGVGAAFHGQDSNYTGNQPSYVDDGDGTVTDLNTGLMWMRTPIADVGWSAAMSGADSCVVGGYDDWRMPTIKELYSLIRFDGYTGQAESTSNPFIDTNYFDFEYGDTTTGERMIDAQMWSATDYVGLTMGDDATAFGVNFADGRIKGYPSDMMDADVIYVRGNTSYGVNSFYDNGDGTINDEATGLTWMQADSGYGMEWEDALAYSEALTHGGHTDWRLPNIKELQSIVDYDQAPAATDAARVGPAIDTDYFDITNIGGTASPDYGYFWSGTTHVEGGTGDYAGYIAFGYAWGYMNGAYLDVHGAGAQRSDPKADIGQDTIFGPQGDILRMDNYVRVCRDTDAPITLTGTAAAEGIGGESGNDTINGGGGDDTISGSGGRDWVNLGDSGGYVTLSLIETLIGGAGTDQVTLGTTSPSGIILAAVEGLIGSAEGDWVNLGNRGNTMSMISVETLIGGSGADVVYLGAGGNTVIVAAIETLGGGSGTDMVTLGNRGCTMTIWDLEQVSGGGGNDVLVSGGGALRFTGNGGADRITLGGAAEQVVFATTADGGTAGAAYGHDVVTGFGAGDGVVVGGTLRGAVDADGDGALSGTEAITLPSLTSLTNLAAVASGAGSVRAGGTVLLIAHAGGDSGLYVGKDTGNGVLASSEVSLLAMFGSTTLTAASLTLG
ncbi:MAG: DUF1566 domain-containing protein [Alphaproteobacteria bacterium]|nr:DUF1566 domain-containing protein [Alphaproteobacteria bacterium]